MSKYKNYKQIPEVEKAVENIVDSYCEERRKQPLLYKILDILYKKLFNLKED